MTKEYKLFPTLVTKTSNLLDAQQCADVSAYIKDLYMTEHGAIQGDAKSSHETERLYLLDDIVTNVSSCKDIRENIIKAVKDYKERSQFNIKAIDNSWSNIQDEGSVLTQHTHPLSVISGALYVYVDSDSSKLCFDNPNPYTKFTNVSGDSEFTYGSFWLTPSVGDLILFPSWLSHGSGHTPNNTKGRTVISFNTI